MRISLPSFFLNVRETRNQFDSIPLRLAPRVLAGLVGLTLAVNVGAKAKAAEPEAFEYMVQKVCLDGTGALLHLSPLDKKCAAIRDLQLGEALPYHKHDWPAENLARTQPEGYQSGDSVPLRLKTGEVVALHTFDFGDGVRKFGVYDGVNGDGLSLVSFQGQYFGSLMTMDLTGGVQLFVNTDKCEGTVSLSSVEAGWAFGPVNLTAAPSGLLSAHVHRVKNLGVPCPKAYTYSTTNWYFVEFKPMAGPNVEGQRALHTLVTEHFAGPDSNSFHHFERMYFSRELGRMRWERWQNIQVQKRDDDQARSAKLLGEGRCAGGVGAPNFAGNWVRVGCREWTNIVPSSDPNGDKITNWLAPIVQGNPGTPLSMIEVN